MKRDLYVGRYCLRGFWVRMRIAALGACVGLLIGWLTRSILVGLFVFGLACEIAIAQTAANSK